MTTDHIPDEVWVEILSRLSPPDLIALYSVSKQFQALVETPLLFNVFWIDYRYFKNDLYAWSQGSKNSLTHIPRTVTISRNLSTHAVGHRAMLDRLTSFTSLHTLTLVDISLDVNIYTALDLPTLQTLIIINCEFDIESDGSPIDIDFGGFPLRHFTLHNLRVPIHMDNDENYDVHPISLLAGRSLDSVEITWTDGIMRAYRRVFVDMANQVPGKQNPFVSSHLTHPKHPAPNLRFLQVHIPLLKRDILSSLTHFTARRTAHGFPLRVDLAVRYWHLTRDEIKEFDRIRLIEAGRQAKGPSHGVWSYTGPPDIMGIFVLLSMQPVDGITMLSTMRTGGDGDDADADDFDGSGKHVLRRLRFLPPAAEPHVMERLLWELGTDVHPVLGIRTRKAKNIFELEVCVARWDVEILLAIRANCGGLRKLVIRVGEEPREEELFVSLGEILSDFPHLRTLHIIHDPESVASDASGGITGRSGYMTHPNMQTSVRMCSPTIVDDDKCEPNGKEKAMFVEYYLNAWGRLCLSLREVQVGDGIHWARCWEGGRWEIRKAARGDEIYLHAMDALKGWCSDF